jgi:hypothetical protein
MNMQAIKTQTATATPVAASDVLRLPMPKQSFVKARLVPAAGALAAKLIPPIVMIGLLLIVWQVLCSKPGATLPSPTKIWTEAYDLIVDPFFVAGPQDIGLGWRVLISLQRVAIGYGLAGVVGILLGTLVGQSVWAMRGLDPIFQVLRTISPLAWLPISLAAFRDSQPSAIFVIFITAVWPIIINTAVGIRNIPDDYRNVAGAPAQSFRILLEDHDPVRRALHLHRAAHRHRPVLARDRRRGNADRRRWHRVLHLGRLELVAHLRNHPRADLRRPGRIRPRQDCRGRRFDRHARHGGELRRPR